jgi:O-6-methylguanine DNA methyltransferase
MPIEWNTFDSPVGPLLMVECPAGPLLVEYPRRSRGSAWMKPILARQPGANVQYGPCLATRGWLEAYFAGHPVSFPYPQYLPEFVHAPPSALAVWRALASIPHGETRSYAHIARQTGLHARAAGRMVGSNHLAILLPCHRVVGADGALVGYGGGLARKRWLLDHELRAGGLRLSGGAY